METTVEISILPFVTISLALAVAFVVGFVRLFAAYKKRINAEVDLKQKIEQAFERRLIEASLESEEINRSRFAMDIHDDIGASLTLLKMKVQYAHTHPEEFKNPQEMYDQTQILIDQTIQKIRQVSQRISPSTIQHFGIIPPLEDLISSINESKQIKIQLTHNFDDQRLGTFTEINLYRILQELLNNILKHAGASKTNISLIMDVEQNQLYLEILHDGRGLNNAEFETILHQSKGHGLKGIQTRVHSLQGKTNFQHPTEKGSEIQITIPI